MNSYLKKLFSVSKIVLILGGALITAAALSSTAFATSITKAHEQARLNSNCRSVSIPQSDHVQTLLDPATGVVKVKWFVGEQEYTTDLPLVVNSHCNAENRALLQRVNKHYTDQVNDTCAEFKEYITGKKSVPEKNGQKGNIAAARAYVKNHCQ